MTPQTLDALMFATESGSGTVLATRLADGAQTLLPDTSASAALQALAREALSQDRTGMADVDGEAWFLHVHAPAHRIIIIGAVHIAQALSSMARSLGLAVTVVDPRVHFATDERFPGVALVHVWPDEALRQLYPDRRTAVVVLTHDPKLDDPALDEALRSEAFFIGALGSRRSHARRLERLAVLGHAPEALRRISGPVGLPIGAVTPAEIALSTLAEVVAVRRGKAGGTEPVPPDPPSTIIGTVAA